MTLMTKETYEALKEYNTCKKCRKMKWNCICEGFKPSINLEKGIK